MWQDVHALCGYKSLGQFPTFPEVGRVDGLQGFAVGVEGFRDAKAQHVEEKIDHKVL